MSPRGGLWISAALPWQGRPPASAMLIGLAVATVLAERLERRGLEVAIKWPNDLLVNGRKLAGLLPRLVQRGSTLRLVRIGIIARRHAADRRVCGWRRHVRGRISSAPARACVDGRAF